MTMIDPGASAPRRADDAEKAEAPGLVLALPPLAGKRVLVVEDEALVAAMLEDMLIELGAAVVGPAFTIAAGLAAAGSETLDLAILDVNVRGERIEAVADLLAARGVPMVFATGYGQGNALGRHAGRPTLAKPYAQKDLAATIMTALAPPRIAVLGG
jgi:DNA-binding response OmpR family regulator